MNTKINTLIIALISISCTAFAQDSSVEELTIQSKELNHEREIMIYKPLGYDVFDDKLYNVIYVFDAQNREFFDFTSSLALFSEVNTIVVGIKAKVIIEEPEEGKPKLLYSRNHDFLPRSTRHLRGNPGNMEGFTAFMKNELIPYIESNYRVLPRKMAIGHSRGASFVLYALATHPDLFDNYVAISPNVKHDDQYILRKLRALNTSEMDDKKHLYVSHADEGEGFRWEAANEDLYEFLEDTLASEKIEILTEQFPEENHLTTFKTSMLSAMSKYAKVVQAEWASTLSNETYTVTFRVEVLEEDDELYIFGNQASLGNWQKDKIKMKKASPLIREITLPVKDHVEVQFSTDGENNEWIYKGEMARTNGALMLRPEEGAVYKYKLTRNEAYF